MAGLPGAGMMVAGSSQSVRTSVGNVTANLRYWERGWDEGSFIHVFQPACIGPMHEHLCQVSARSSLRIQPSLQPDKL